MKKSFIRTSKLMLWLICAAALLITGISLVTTSPIASVKAAGETGTAYEFTYTGDVQSVTLSAGKYTLETWGAQGGDILDYHPLVGGLGGYSKGVINLSSPTTIYVYVGGKAENRLGNHPYPDRDLAPGGWNGGGATYSKGTATGGGGASDIRIGSTELDKRVIVAGGGGGNGWSYAKGGSGGGLTGTNGTYMNQTGTGAYGGTQTAGGAMGASTGNTMGKTPGTFGQGGQGNGYSAGGGGGGGGWYGGGGGGYTDGGGGGSGYVHEGTNAASALDSRFILTETEMESGVREGNGLVKIVKECITYTFNVENQYFTSVEAVFEDGTIAIPEEEPEKIGYLFKGWKNVTDTNDDTLYRYNTEYDTYAIVEPGDIAFEAVFTEEIYDVKFDNSVLDAEIIKDSGLEQTIKIGETGVSLYANPWLPKYRWAIQYPGTQGNLSQDWLIFDEVDHLGTARLTILTEYNSKCIEFINTFVEYYVGTEPEGNRVGKITFKVIDISVSYAVTIVSNDLPAAGALEIGIDESTPMTIGFGQVLSLPTDNSWVKSLFALENQHYRFVSYEVLNASGVPVGEPIFTKVFDSSTDERFQLTNELSHGLKDNYSIRVNYEKIEYRFEFSSSLKGQEDTSLDLISNDFSDGIYIGEPTSFNATALSQSVDERYRFVSWKLYDHIEKTFFYQTNGELGFSADFSAAEITAYWLERYVRDGVVTIVAEYEEAYRIQIRVADGQEHFGSIVITGNDALNGSLEAQSDLDMFLVKGSIIAISASPNSHYEFDKFILADGSLVSDSSYAEMLISSACDIRAVFKPIAYKVLFENRDSKGDKIESTIGEYYIQKNGTETLEDSICLEDILNLIGYETKLPGYRFDGFTIKNVDGAVVTNPTNIVIDQDVLMNNFNTREDRFVITVNYTKLYSVNVNLSESSAGMGTVVVLVESETVPGEYEVTSLREFPINTKLIIRAISTSTEYFDIDCFTNYNATSESGSNKFEIAFTLKNSRSIVVYFKTIPFELETDLNKVDITMPENVMANELRVGDSIVLTATPGSGQEIKKWTINGVSIKDLEKNAKYDVKVSNNAVTIKLTYAWLNDFNNEISSKAEFGMSSSTMTMIIVTSIAVPLLLALFLFYFINLKKKEALIKKELQEEYKAKQKFGTSSLLQDLREGKEVGVTDEAIKKAMKEKKKKTDSKN